ncbi:hypothetical protein CLU79DRAFT_272879 [Phycomyces nitens]|nr:hypothetical protein CLU79DRAFT_272879 [Phycomyces nitens]
MDSNWHISVYATKRTRKAIFISCWFLVFWFFFGSWLSSCLALYLYLFLYFIMPSQQQIAWGIYTITFLSIFIMLVWRCKLTGMSIPIILFTAGSIVGLCFLLFGHVSPYEDFYYLAGRSQILDHLPFITVLLFAGVIDPQVSYIQHAFKVGPSLSSSDAFVLPPGTNSRMRNSGSFDLEKPLHLFPREPSYQKELMPPRPQMPQRLPNPQKNTIFKKYLACIIGLFSLYTITAVIYVVFRILRYVDQARVITAICTTILAMLAWTNTIVLFYGTRSSVTRCIPLFRLRQSDTQNVWIMSFLFAFSITGMAIVSWIYWSLQANMAVIAIPYWILIESLLVYAPLATLLFFYARERNISLTRNQYGLHVGTKRKNTSVGPKSLPQEEMKYVTREISLQTARNTLAPVETHPRPLSYQNKTEPLPL